MLDLFKKIDQPKHSNKRKTRELSKFKELVVLNFVQCCFCKVLVVHFLDRIVTCNEKLIIYDNRKRFPNGEIIITLSKVEIKWTEKMVTDLWYAIRIADNSFLKSNWSTIAEDYFQQVNAIDVYFSKMLQE